MFSYDFENRLTSWSSNGTTLNQTQSWSLSLEGAWNSTTVNGNSETRTFNETYETLFSNSNPMSHDRKGNLTQNKDGSLYTWDFDNQLAFSTSGTPSVNAAYAYDALGRRVSKSSGNTITVFVHTNYQIATEYKSINGGAFTEHQSFVYASYIDDPIALTSTNGTYFYHSNQQFSIGAITDSNGNLSERYGYNAYGKPVVITDSILVDNPYFFTGRQLDSETGLFYFRARYYDASLGNFISRDPIGYVDGMNLYLGYFVNRGVDPSGKNTVSTYECINCPGIAGAHPPAPIPPIPPAPNPPVPPAPGIVAALPFMCWLGAFICNSLNNLISFEPCDALCKEDCDKCCVDTYNKKFALLNCEMAGILCGCAFMGPGFSKACFIIAAWTTIIRNAWLFADQVFCGRRCEDNKPCKPVACNNSQDGQIVG